MTHQGAVRIALCYATLFEDDDLIAVIDGPQPMSNKDTRPSLFLQYAVDVLEEALLGVGVECRSLLPG